MHKVKLYKNLREKRKARVRSGITGTAKKPRLSVFRSNKNIYVQAINDELGLTLHASLGTKKDAEKVGLDFGKALVKKGINKGVFDRGGYKYHGIVKKLCEGVRKGGLNI